MHWTHLLSDMFSKSRQFVELDEGDDEQSIPAWSTFKTPSALKSYCSKIRSRRPVFLVAFERLFPRLFYGWVIVFACGIGNQLVFFIFLSWSWYIVFARLVVCSPRCNFWRWSLCGLLADGPRCSLPANILGGPAIWILWFLSSFLCWMSCLVWIFQLINAQRWRFEYLAVCCQHTGLWRSCWQGSCRRC